MLRVVSLRTLLHPPGILELSGRSHAPIVNHVYYAQSIEFAILSTSYGVGMVRRDDDGSPPGIPARTHGHAVEIQPMVGQARDRLPRLPSAEAIFRANQGEVAQADVLPRTLAIDEEQKRIRQRVKNETSRSRCHRDPRDVIAELNPVLRG
jgi:hypothetical protein